jgi:hypothetical protein
MPAIAGAAATAASAAWSNAAPSASGTLAIVELS